MPWWLRGRAPLLLAMLLAAVALPVVPSSAATEPPLKVVKTPDVNPVTVGGLVTFTVSVTNPRSSATGPIVVEDVLGSGAQASVVSVRDDSGANCQLRPASNDLAAQCVLDNLAPGATWHIFVGVIPTAAVPFTNSATAISSKEPTLDASSPTVTEQVTNGTPPPITKLEIQKTASAEKVRINGAVTYTISVRNPFPYATGPLNVTDLLPAKPSTNIIAVSSDQNGKCDFTGDSASCTIASLAAGATWTTTVTVQALHAGRVVNTATVTAQNDLTVTNTAQAIINVTGPAIQPPPLEVVKTPDVNPVIVNGLVNFTITVRNPRPTETGLLLLDDQLAASSGAQIVSIRSLDPGARCTLPIGAITTTGCALESLAPNSTWTVVVGVIPSRVGTFTNTANVLGAADATFSASGSAIETVVSGTPPPIPSLNITKTASPNPVLVGNSVTYVVKITNPFDHPIEGLHFEDQAPGGLGIDSVAGDLGSTCALVAPSTNGPQATCSLTTLGAGQTWTITLTGIADSAGTFVNTGLVSAINDLTVSNQASVTVKVVRPHLSFVTQPSNTLAGNAITPAVSVAIVDDSGTVIPTATGSITVALGANPGGATLSGSVSVNAVDGVASFSNLMLDKPGSGYTLVASATGVTSATSTGFNVSVPLIPITLSPPVLPDGTQDVAYNTLSIAASGGVGGPYIFAVTSGSLPPGLSLNPNGQLSGTPTAFGTYSFTVTATDGAGNAGSQPYNLRILAPPVVLAPAVLPDGVASNPYTQTLTAGGGAGGPYTFTVTTGSLPPGLTLDPGGMLSGSPTAAGTYAFTVTATDHAGNLGTNSYNLNVTAPTITVSPATLPNATVGGPYSQIVTATGGAAPYVFGPAVLPDGLTLNGVTGVIEGTPTTPGTFTFTVSATDLNGFIGHQQYTITVAAAPATMLVFGQQPSDTTAGMAISPAVTVKVEDGLGNVVINANNVITLTVSPSVTVQGNWTVSAVNGVATFSDIRVNTAGTGFTLSASSPGLTRAISAPFSVPHAPAFKLEYDQQPSDATAGTAIAPPVTVKVEDAFGNLVINANDPITVSAGGTLTVQGTLTVNAVNGVATFGDLSITTVGSFTLSASSPGLVSATSSPFIVSVAAPTNLNASAGPGGIALTWIGTGANSYNVFRSLSSGVYGAPFATTITNTYLDSSAVPGTKYYYVVTALFAGQASAPSNEASAMLLPPPPPPPVLGASATPIGVALSWTPGAGVTSYQVFRSQTPGAYSSTPLATITSTTYLDSTAVPGITYYYVVIAVGPGGMSPPSNEVNVTP